MSLHDDLSGDLLSMLDTDEFAILATIGNASVKVIFDDASTVVTEATGEVGTSAPQVTCRTSDVTSVVQGTTVTINSIAYKAIKIEPDGTGITIIYLSRD